MQGHPCITPGRNEEVRPLTPEQATSYPENSVPVPDPGEMLAVQEKSGSAPCPAPPVLLLAGAVQARIEDSRVELIHNII